MWEGGRVCGASQQAEGLESHQEHRHVLASGTGRNAVVQGKEPRRAEGPSSVTLRLLGLGGSSPVPFLLRGCSASTSWPLQADPKQGPPMALSGNGESFAAHQVGFGRKGNLVLWLSCAHLSHECHHAGVGPQGRTSSGQERTPVGW